MTHYGFTGTSVHVEIPQRFKLGMYVIDTMKPGDWFHHGDCIEADEIAHATVKANAPYAKIHLHPPIKGDKRAWCEGYDVKSAELSYFARNREIVDASEKLLAMPLSTKHEDRGGTWYTVDYALKKGVPVTIFWPDGSMTEEYRNV